MGKSHVNISIDPYIEQQAKDKGLNISELAERAIVKKLNPENQIDTTGTKCEYCGKEMRQATANDMNGLYWFLPDEKWICPTCENEFIKKIIRTVEGEKKIVSIMSEELRQELRQEAKEFVNLMKKEILEQIKDQEPFNG